jgi:hypothetical protein
LIAFITSMSEVFEYESFFKIICHFLELKINLKKNVRDTLLDFLDIELNIMTMIVRLSDFKRKKVIQWFNKMLFKKMIKNELQFFLNFLSFAVRVVLSRRIFLRRLFNSFFQSWKDKRRVDVEIKTDLLWWKYFLSKWNEMKFLKKVEIRREFVLWTNAFDEYDMKDYFVLCSEASISSADNMQKKLSLYSSRNTLMIRERHLFIIREWYLLITRERHLFITRERHFSIIRRRHFSIIRERHFSIIRERHFFIIQERHFFIIRERHLFTIREIYFSINRKRTRVHKKNHFSFFQATRSFNLKICFLSY